MITKPLLVVPAISKNGGIKFILSDKEIVLGEEVAEKAWTILELCNGINTVDFIVEQLSGIEEDFVRGFLDDLGSLGIVADSRKYYKHFHASTSHPMPYSSDITTDEIAEHFKSSRMPVKDGRDFTFRRNPESALYALQRLRTSCRSFTGESLSIDEIGGLLDIGYSLERRAVPSAGGLYPMKVFAVALEDQKDFPAGYYEYDNESNRLVLFNRKPDPQRIFYAFNDTEMPYGASVVFVIAADADRQPRKYSNRGYRFMLIEAGQIAQNISLGAVEIGLATCELGSMLDDVVTDELGLGDCLPILAIAVGKNSGSTAVTSWQTADSLESEFVGDGRPIQRLWMSVDTSLGRFSQSYVQCLATNKNNQTSGGISTCGAVAKIRAIAEGYERQRATGVRWDVRSSARKLSEPWLDPRIVAPLTDEQYDHLPYLQRFDENLEVEWIRGIDHAGKTVLVPIDLVFYPIRDIERKLVVDTCSSGFAAFTNFRGAVERGVLELVERDSLMRNWYERTSLRRLGFNTLPIHLQNRVRYWKERDREVFVLDISQRGVIAIEVVITSDEYPCFVSGASSTLDRFEEAAIKAFYEAEAQLIYSISGEEVPPFIEPRQVSRARDHGQLYAQSKDYHEYVQFLFNGVFSDRAPVVSTSFSLLERELETVTVDVSEEHSSLRVVRVLSPKLIPISFGYGTDHYTHHSLRRARSAAPIVPHYFA